MGEGWRGSCGIPRCSSRRWLDTCSGSGLLSQWSTRMLDLVFIAATVGFFAAAFAYARACEHV
jgi:hypothetical protein